jgi:two-component sensor histidine kinase
MRQLAMRESSDFEGHFGLSEQPPEYVNELINAIEQLARSTHLADVAQVVPERARQLMNADGASLVLREDNECVYVGEDAIGPLWSGQRFPIPSRAAGQAMLQKKNLVIADVRQDAHDAQQAYIRTFVVGLAIVPVRSGDPIGAIEVYWAKPYGASPQEVARLETLARATTSAIEHVRLVDVLSRALTDAELARDELRHRIKNAYAAVQALAALSLPSEHAHALSIRLMALARAHQLLDHELAQRSTVDFRELISTELEPYGPEITNRIRLEGSALHVDGPRAVALGLVLNELATNALKYGALSKEEGRLVVRWWVDSGWFSVSWIERDGPEVKAAAVENFGSRLLRRIVEQQLQGQLERRFEAKGVECRISIPL